jgi:uncharacterized membrane protein
MQRTMRNPRSKFGRKLAATALAASLSSVAFSSVASANDGCETHMQTIQLPCIQGPGIHDWGGGTYFVNFNGTCAAVWFTVRCEVTINV